MKVEEIKGLDKPAEYKKTSEEEIQNEYNYLLAKQMTNQLLDAELINAEEYKEIMARNVKFFRPFFSRISAC